MLKKIERFSTSGDFELGYEHRDRETEYSLYLPEGTISDTLVIYIPGFGNDAEEYRKVFCEKVCEKYQFATMTVDYHCLFARAKSIHNFRFEPTDEVNIGQLLMKYFVPVNQGESTLMALDRLNQHLQANNINESLTATLLPEKNEYQNGGLIAALDILNAIKDAANKYSVAKTNIILVGSSYGSYVANLVTKIAPNTIKAVVDNSSWAKLNISYVVGRDYNVPENAYQHWSNIALRYFVLSAWTTRPNLPYTFDNNRYYIRCFTEEQITQMANYQTSCFYYFTHPKDDPIAPTGEKIQMAQDLMGAGFDVHMEVYSEEDIDGKYIKDMSHGMGLSMLTLFDRALPLIEARPEISKTDFYLNSEITYQSLNLSYTFVFSDIGVRAFVSTIDNTAT